MEKSDLERIIAELEKEISELEERIERMESLSYASFDWKGILTEFFGIKTAHADLFDLEPYDPITIQGGDDVPLSKMQDFLMGRWIPPAMRERILKELRKRQENLNKQKDCLNQGGTPSTCDYNPGEKECLDGRTCGGKAGKWRVNYPGVTFRTCCCPGTSCFCEGDEVLRGGTCCKKTDVECLC